MSCSARVTHTHIRAHKPPNSRCTFRKLVNWQAGSSSSIVANPLRSLYSLGRSTSQIKSRAQPKATQSHPPSLYAIPSALLPLYLYLCLCLTDVSLPHSLTHSPHPIPSFLPFLPYLLRPSLPWLAVPNDEDQSRDHDGDDDDASQSPSFQTPSRFLHPQSNAWSSSSGRPKSEANRLWRHVCVLGWALLCCPSSQPVAADSYSSYAPCCAVLYGSGLLLLWRAESQLCKDISIGTCALVCERGRERRHTTLLQTIVQDGL